MQTIEEKRVFGDQGDTVDAFVASETGVVRVRIAGETVGEFGLCLPGAARDVVATRDGVAVATEEDVRLLEPPAGEDARLTDVVVTDTGFGPAVAVGQWDGAVLAASPAGRVARYETGQWQSLGTLESEVRAIDGDLVATADGVARLSDDGITEVGLTDVTDVSAGPVPLAATADGLYQLANGWLAVASGSFTAVVSDADGEGRLECAHAAGSSLWRIDAASGEWVESPAPRESIVALAAAESTYAVTATGAFLIEHEPGQWRSRHLGVRGVTAMTVVRDSEHS